MMIMLVISIIRMMLIVIVIVIVMVIVIVIVLEDASLYPRNIQSPGSFSERRMSTLLSSR